MPCVPQYLSCGDVQSCNAYLVFDLEFESPSVDDVDVVVQVNVESQAGATKDSQAGSYNGIPVADGTYKLSAPVILADFYGYYTNLVVQNVDTSGGTCSITYTSDDVYSAQKTTSKAYNHSIGLDGSFTVYEGRKGGQEIGDINSDVAWRSGGAQQFIGAASIVCDVKVVGFVNEEKDVLGYDSMYTMNTFNLEP